MVSLAHNLHLSVWVPLVLPCPWLEALTPGSLPHCFPNLVALQSQGIMALQCWSEARGDQQQHMHNAILSCTCLLPNAMNGMRYRAKRGLFLCGQQ